MLNKEREEKINKTETLVDVFNACTEYGFNVTEEQLEKAIETADKEALFEEDLAMSAGEFVSVTVFLIESVF